MLRWGAALIAILLFVYPFAIYYGLLYLQPAVISLSLAVLFCLRLAVIWQSAGKEAFQQQLFPVVGVICLLLGASALNSREGLQLTPVFMNAGFLCLFAYTLFKPPSMIERFARLMHEKAGEDVPSYVVDYTRKVTWVWCLFFIGNGSAALYTALYSDMKTWALYNGFIAYLLMAALFALEYGVRLWVRAKHEV